MKGILRTELRRAFTGYRFWIAVGVCVGLSVAHYIDGVLLPMLDYWNYFQMKTMGGLVDPITYYPPTVFTMLWPGSSSLPIKQLYPLLTPFLVCLPYCDSLLLDRNSGYVKNVLVRTSRFRFHSAKFITVFLTGGIISALPKTLSLLLNSVTLPSIIPEVTARNVPVFPFSMWGELLFSYPYIYCLLFIFLNFVFFGLLATLALGLSYMLTNRFAAIIAPYAVYFAWNTVITSTKYYNYAPGMFLDWTQSVASTGFVLLMLALLAAVSVGMYTVYAREDVF